MGFGWVIGRLLSVALVERPAGLHVLVRRPGGKGIAMRRHERHSQFVVDLSTRPEEDLIDRERGVVEEVEDVSLRSN